MTEREQYMELCKERIARGFCTEDLQQAYSSIENKNDGGYIWTWIDDDRRDGWFQLTSEESAYLISLVLFERNVLGINKPQGYEPLAEKL